MTTHWTEAAIAAALEGKFYLVNGKDRNEIERLEREEEQRRKAANAIRQYHADQAEQVIASSGAHTPQAIIAAVACAHRLPAGAITSRARFKHISHARQHACALMRELTGLSFQAIAAAVGIVDHSTAHHAVKTWAQRGHVYAIEDKRAREMLGAVR